MCRNQFDRILYTIVKANVYYSTEDTYQGYAYSF